MFAILDAPERTAGTRTIDPHDTGIEAAGVGYSYDGERVVLENVRFRAARLLHRHRRRKRVGQVDLRGHLVGRARANRSVQIGGVELHDVDASSLHEAIVTVTHDSYLFKGTLRSNLLLAKPDASDEGDDARPRTRARARFRPRIGRARHAHHRARAATSRAGSASASPWRAPSFMTRRCTCSTRPHPTSTPTARTPSSGSSRSFRARAPSSWCRIVSARSRKPTASTCSRTGAWWRRRPMPSLVEAGGAYARMWEKQAHLERRLIGES